MRGVLETGKSLLPGLSVAVLVAMAAQFLSEHYGALAVASRMIAR